MNRIHALLHNRLLPTLRFRSIATAGFLFSLAILMLFQHGDQVKASLSEPTPGTPTPCFTSGSLDTLFDGDGKVILPVGSLANQAYSIAVQPDGKIVAAGDRKYGPGPEFSDFAVARFDFAVVRYSADGSLDATFDGDGNVTTQILGTDVAFSAALQADGKIVAGGYTDNAPSGLLTLVRYGEPCSGSPTNTPTNTPTVTPTNTATPTGTSTNTPTPTPFQCVAGALDPSFNGTGKVVTPIGDGDDSAVSVAMQTDGKIVAAGRTSPLNGSDTDFAVVRYNTDGTPDTSFGGDGTVTTAVGSGGDWGNAVAIQADGRIVVAGASYSSATGSDFALVRYNTDGTLDTSFDGDGKAITPISNNLDWAWSVVIQADGRIVAAGYTRISAQDFDFTLVRYNPDGTLDTTFNGTGIVVTPIGIYDDEASSVAIQPDGKIVAAGKSGGITVTDPNNDFTLVRYNANGTLDTTFNGTGKVVTQIPGSDLAHSLVIQPDSRIVLAGSHRNSSNYDFALARYNTDGSADTTFNGTGIVMTLIGNGDDFCNSVAIQPDGSIVAAGQSQRTGGPTIDIAVVRYNTNGALDTTFNSTGKVVTPVGFPFAWGESVMVQPDGRIVVSGESYNGSGLDFTLVRYFGSATCPPTPTTTPTSTPTTNPTNTPSPPTLSGTVIYANDQIAGPSPRFVSDVSISASGATPIAATTGSDGTYSLTGFGAGAYTVTPSKAGGHNQYVTSFDAAKIAQYAAGTISFNPAQQAAADVSGNGSVTSFDASMVANYAVSSSPAGSTGNWIFSPATRTYASVTADITGEDYSALLMGEVSGNWTDSGVRAVGSRQLQSAAAEDSATESGGVASEKIAVTAPWLVMPANDEIAVPVRIEGAAAKGIISYEFDLRYDPAVLQPLADPVDITGTVSRGLSVAVNPEEQGLLRVAVYGATPIGDGVLLHLRFEGVGAPGSISQLTWERIVFNEGHSQTAAHDGQVEFSAAAPDQAEISGRLLTTMGQGVPHARVTLTDSAGHVRSVLSNGFGVYRFGSLQVGQIYSISVDAKRYTFAPLTVCLTDQLVSLEMIARQ